jgi:hypothetical protein
VGALQKVVASNTATDTRFDNINMPLTTKLDRKLRAAEESSDDDDEYYEVTDRSSSESVIDTGAGGDILGSDSENEQDSEDAEMVRQSFRHRQFYQN